MESSEYIPRSKKHRKELGLGEKPTFNKYMVALVVCLNVPFAAAVLFIFYKIGQEPVTMIKYWSTTMVGELLAMAALKWRETAARERNPDVDY